MAKLRHLAIATDDPDRTAQFYIDVFEFQKIREAEGKWGYGHILSDGTINLAILRFTTDTRIPPTNNQAEKDLRPHKTQQKISGRLTSDTATRHRLRIRGYLSTATKHGRNAITTLCDIHLGRPWIPPLPAGP